MAEYLKLILDIIILAGLGGFIFYAMQLSKALNAFRAHRYEFDNIMQDLTKHIDNAQIAVNELKETSQVSGDNLHKLVRDAQFLSDELQQINDVSNSLAVRLENAAERGRKNLEVPDSNLGENVSPISRKKSKPDGFSIHDPDFNDGEASDALDDDPELQKLSSAAERELFKALRKNKS
ncbi:MAG: DUF6468 domain-containing protein [Bdellovibrionales bacterium]